MHVGRVCRTTGTGVRVEDAADLDRHDRRTLRGGFGGRRPSGGQDQDTRIDVRRVRRYVERQALRHIGVQRVQRILQEERPPQTHIQVGYNYYTFI